MSETQVYSIQDILESIKPGKPTAFDEAKDSIYAKSVYVNNIMEKDFLAYDKDILLLVGGKGSGKTNFYLHLQNTPQIYVKRPNDSRPLRIVCAFVNADRAKCRPAQDAFRTLASAVHDYVAQHKIAFSEAFKATHPVHIERNWYHMLAYEALEAVRNRPDILRKLAIPGIPLRARLWFILRCWKRALHWWKRMLRPTSGRLRSVPKIFRRGFMPNSLCDRKRVKAKEILNRLADYVRAYDLSANAIAFNRVMKWVFRLFTGRKWKLRFNIAFRGIDIKFEELEIDPRDVMADIDSAMKLSESHMYIFVDTLDELLGREYEDVRLCLLGTFMDLAVNWNEQYSCISLKLLMRTEYALRAEYDHMDRIVIRYRVLKWEEDQFMHLIMKRLLYSELVRRAVAFNDNLSALESMKPNEKEILFNKFFGGESFSFPDVITTNVNPYFSIQNLKPLQFLYRYFLDGKESILLRHVVDFLRFCIDIEIRSRDSNTQSNAEITPATPLFQWSTLYTVLFVALPQVFFEKLNREYDFVRGSFGRLVKLCDQRFTKEKFLELFINEKKQIDDLSVKTDKADITLEKEKAETALTALFYSGLIGGDAKLLQSCNEFYFPVFVCYALKYGFRQRDNLHAKG